MKPFTHYQYETYQANKHLLPTMKEQFQQSLQTLDMDLYLTLIAYEKAVVNCQ